MANLELLSGQVLRDTTGLPYTGAKASYWADAGLSVALDTFSNADCASGHENTNPVVADGTTGAFPAIYLKAARYWRTVTTSALVSLSGYNIGPIDPAPGFVASLTAPSPTYPFLVWYDTTTGHKKTRASDNLSWIDNGAIDSLINAATVAQQITGTSALVASTPASVGGLWLAGTAVSISANNISLPSTGGGVFTCSSATTTLNTISSSTEGRLVEIIFTNSQTITHGSGIVTLGQITYTVPAGARVWFKRDASTWTIVRQAFITTPGQLAYIGTQRFTASGTYTRSKGCAWAFVRTVGPGGGGASSDTGSGSNGSGGGGGGSGGYCEEWVTPGTTETVTIGAGGALQSTAATAGNNGSGASSFGSFHSAGAGNGGATMANAATGVSAAGGAAGAASNGGVNINGQAGAPGCRINATSGLSWGGDGGSNPLGNGGRGGRIPATANAGAVGTGYGAGGGGGAVTGNNGSANGAAGTDGICIVDEWAQT